VPIPSIDTESGLIWPFTSFAMSAYGTLRTAALGDISGSPPTLIPRARSEPLKSPSPKGVIEPRLTEK
jgi:hypothetical protein